jgi:hypothetical protein
MQSAPILVLGFNRPDYLRKLLRFLETQRIARLYISIDGPLLDDPTSEALVEECKKLAIATQEWTETRLLLSDTNYGCYLGVTKAIDWFFEHEEFGIILEDDLVLSSTAIRFLTDGLSFYSERMDVGAVCAFNNLFPYSISGEPVSTLIVSFPSSWGWATWRDRWGKIERDFSSYSKPLFIYKSLKYGGISGARTWLHIRKRLEENRLDSWAYRWLMTHCRYGWKTIVPSRSLITNIGFRDDATHTRKEKEILGVQSFFLDDSHPRISFGGNLDKSYDNFLLKNIYGVIPFGERLTAKIKSLFSIKFQ